ncbi:MAG TPA: hypothetical protein DDY13_16535 [Cytophagales bacterium]|jgi:hypothetical protein|nr:hypothetical protein [Cytophagales bacterium]
MKRTILLTLMFIISMTAISFAQSDKGKEMEKMSKAEKKALKQAEMKANKDSLLQIIENKQWVLEAYQLQGKYGQTFNLSPTTNFVAVKGDRNVWQFAFNGLIGWNGIGGITIDGKVTKYEVSPGKKAKSAISIRMNTMAPGTGPANIIMTVTSDGHARATVSGAFSNDRLTFTGKLSPLEMSNIYKGTSLF